MIGGAVCAVYVAYKQKHIFVQRFRTNVHWTKMKYRIWVSVRGNNFQMSQSTVAFMYTPTHAHTADALILIFSIPAKLKKNSAQTNDASIQIDMPSHTYIFPVRAHKPNIRISFNFWMVWSSRLIQSNLAQRARSIIDSFQFIRRANRWSWARRMHAGRAGQPAC